MKTSNNNRLRTGALLSLYVTSYIPLFLIVIVKQVSKNRVFLHWGGFNEDAFICFRVNFGMSFFLALVTVAGLFGMLILLQNIKSRLHSGQIVKITKISNRNSESIGYIATYIVPFMTSDFSSIVECLVFIVIMGLIYTIYINSNMILINPLLSLKYSLLEIEYVSVGDNSTQPHDALIITDTKDYKENVNYDVYQIGFKLYYGKER